MIWSRIPLRRVMNESSLEYILIAWTATGQSAPTGMHFFSGEHSDVHIDYPESAKQCRTPGGRLHLASPGESTPKHLKPPEYPEGGISREYPNERSRVPRCTLTLLLGYACEEGYELY